MGQLKHSVVCIVCGKTHRTDQTGVKYCSPACKQKKYRQERNDKFAALRHSDTKLRHSVTALREEKDVTEKELRDTGQLAFEMAQVAVSPIDNVSKTKIKIPDHRGMKYILCEKDSHKCSLCEVEYDRNKIGGRIYHYKPGNKIVYVFVCVNCFKKYGDDGFFSTPELTAVSLRKAIEIGSEGRAIFKDGGLVCVNPKTK